MKISDNKFTDANCQVSSNKKLSFKVSGQKMTIRVNRGLFKQVFRNDSCIKMLVKSVNFVNRTIYHILEKISDYIMVFKYYQNNPDYINLWKIRQCRSNYVISDIENDTDPISAYKFMSDEDEEDNNE